MANLNDILLNHNCFLRENPESAEIISKIEQEVKFSLPHDYTTYLLKYTRLEDSIGHEYVALWDVTDLIEYNNLVIENLPNTIGIGSNGASEMIAIEQLGKDSYRVVLTPFIDLDSQFHVEIGTSFTDFLARLESGHEWFGKEI